MPSAVSKMSGAWPDFSDSDTEVFDMENGWQKINPEKRFDNDAAMPSASFKTSVEAQDSVVSSNSTRPQWEYSESQTEGAGAEPDSTYRDEVPDARVAHAADGEPEQANILEGKAMMESEDGILHAHFTNAPVGGEGADTVQPVHPQYKPYQDMQWVPKLKELHGELQSFLKVHPTVAVNYKLPEAMDQVDGVNYVLTRIAHKLHPCGRYYDTVDALLHDFRVLALHIPQCRRTRGNGDSLFILFVSEDKKEKFVEKFPRLTRDDSMGEAKPASSFNLQSTRGFRDVRRLPFICQAALREASL